MNTIRPRHQQRLGVTAPLTGFLPALTQFLGASDVSRLARVSCADLQATDKVWIMCRAMLSPVAWLSTLAVVRQDTVLRPQCLAYAVSHARNVIQTFLTSPHSGHVSFGMIHMAVHWAYNISFAFSAPHGNQRQILSSPLYRDFPCLDDDPTTKAFRDSFWRWGGRLRTLDECIGML